MLETIIARLHKEGPGWLEVVQRGPGRSAELHARPATTTHRPAGQPRKLGSTARLRRLQSVIKPVAYGDHW